MSKGRSWLAALAVGTLMVGALASPSAAITNSELKEAWKFVKKKLSAAGTINASGNPVNWTKLKNVPGGIADGTDDVAEGACDVGDFVTGIAANGSLVCGTPGGSGDITGVAAGTGLSGGGASGDVALAVDPTAVQTRLQTACAAGSTIRSVDQAGAVTCSVDQGSNREVVTQEFLASGGSVSAGGAATCPSGKVPVGGGATLSTGPEDGSFQGVVLQTSHPGTDYWFANAIETTANGFPWAITVYAICVTPG